MPRHDVHDLADFADIPPERLEECLLEFAEYIGLVRERIAEMQEDGVSELRVEKWKSRLTFMWIDDGIRGPLPEFAHYE